MPVTRHTAAKNATTVPSIENTIQYGLPMSAVLASNHRTPAYARPRPATPATNASSTLSTSSCRTMRHRVAPIETRTAISRERSAARASSRLATFAQAMSSTNATAPMSDQNSTRICVPMTCSENGADDCGHSLVGVGKLSGQLLR